jgi:hypothetical protein
MLLELSVATTMAESLLMTIAESLVVGGTSTGGHGFWQAAPTIAIIARRLVSMVFLDMINLSTGGLSEAPVRPLQ